MQPIVLCILDGWGHRLEKDNNAIAEAHIPHWHRMMASCPHTLLATSGRDVGLPDGQMGNSEVGHMNIGSGRIVMQDLPKIDQAIQDGSLKHTPPLTHFISTLSSTQGACHIMGLLSDGGVHSHQGHIHALAHYCAGAGLKVYLHMFLDGRDTPPQSALTYLHALEKAISPFPSITLATLSGRYYAMDRDNRWDRIEKAYVAMVEGKGNHFASAQEAIHSSYSLPVTDEFVLPAILGPYSGMHDGDGIIMANFRADRVRQILSALLVPEFNAFSRSRTIRFSSTLGMVEYATGLNRFLPSIFPSVPLTNILGEVVAAHHIPQLRIAETEKYAHVTFFFNGGKEEPFPYEERILIPSPQVATYDMQPEMSALEVTRRLIEAISLKKYGLMIVNYANTDMVGHTGNKVAAIKAVEVIDACLHDLHKAIDEAGGILIITADHGNAEMMVDPHTGTPHTAHTTGPVPFILAGKKAAHLRVKKGRLSDVAPTLLSLMYIEKPKEMTGEPLFI